MGMDQEAISSVIPLMWLLLNQDGNESNLTYIYN